MPKIKDFLQHLWWSIEDEALLIYEDILPALALVISLVALMLAVIACIKTFG